MIKWHHMEYSEKRLQTLQKIQKLPNVVGVVLVGTGLAGIVLPGMAGVPLLLIGGFVLSPWKVVDIDGFLHRKFPETYMTSMEMMDRFLRDFERRYPDEANEKDGPIIE